MASLEAQKYRPLAPVTLAFVTVRSFPSTPLSLHIDDSVLFQNVWRLNGSIITFLPSAETRRELSCKSVYAYNLKAEAGLTRNVPRRWGQSAGAISASLQMLAYNGSSQDLFHGAFLQSGAPLPLDSILNGQVCSTLCYAIS